LSRSIRTRALVVAGALSLTGATVIAVGTSNVAGAKPVHAGAATSASTPKAGALPHGGPTAPPGYNVQFAGFTAGNGTQTRGSVACASGTVAFGGGAVLGSSSLAANLNSSFPESGGAGWAVDVNNASGADSAVNVYVVCADQPTGYAIETSSEVDNPPGAQTRAVVSCPKRTVSLGGGFYSTSGSTDVNANSTFPSVSGKIYSWDTDMNNNSGVDAAVISYAVCGKKPKGFTVVAGSPVDNPPGAETFAAANCPAKTSPIGGGVYSNTGSVVADINSTYPGSTSWSAYENNGSGSDSSVTPYATCAK
jgi:hypothetical protein